MGEKSRDLRSPLPDQSGSSSPTIRPIGSGSPGLEPEPPKPKITHSGQALVGGMSTRHESSWKRKTNTTGTGATHVKTFHCKLAGESIELLDRQINEWLDSHPEYEVKLVTTSIGEWQGKIKEPNLIVQVWV
jgi:hypothetical protein